MTPPTPTTPTPDKGPMLLTEKEWANLREFWIDHLDRHEIALAVTAYATGPVRATTFRRLVNTLDRARGELAAMEGE